MLDNKYAKWYNNIIAFANTRDFPQISYVEKHHIIPKSLGGSDDDSNIVCLTAREHFICHMLLVRMTTGKDKRKMLHAVGMFVQNGKYLDRILTSRQYEYAKRSISEARTGVHHSKKTRQKISESSKGQIPWNKGLIGVQHVSEERKLTVSKLHTGKILSKETKRKISERKKGHKTGMTGKQHSNETRQKMSESQKKLMSTERREHLSKVRQGIKFSDEHKKNLTNANKANGMKRRGQKIKTIKCPHCGKTGGSNGMNRYHFNKCRENMT